MNQGFLFEPPQPEPITGAQLRDAGVALISQKRRPVVQVIYEVIKMLARNPEPFTTDDVRNHLSSDEFKQAGFEIPHPNVIGAAFHKASKAGVIVAIGAVNAEVPSAHSRLVRQWKGASHVR